MARKLIHVLKQGKSSRMSFRDYLSRLGSVLYRPVISRRSAVIFLALSLTFVIALLMRIYPAIYGWYLNEFDPYFDYYASLHVVTLAQQHGLYYALFNNPAGCTASVLTSCHTQQGYFYWHDVKTWYPYGRDVAATSQVGLQLTGAFLYLFVNSILRIPVSYYDFLVFFPALIGTLTIIPLYYLVKKITNSAGGIFAALIFAVSPPILERGNLGWFKSEPLSLFLATIGAYFFLCMYNAKISTRGMMLRALIAGLMFGYADISWGGGDEFVLLFGLVFLVAPFVKSIDIQRTVQGGSILIGSLLFVAAATPRPGISIITDSVGAPLLGTWLFALLAYFLKRYGEPTAYLRNLIKVLLILIFGGLIVISFGALGSISGRYLTVIYSAYRSTNPLIQSVAEQFVPTGSQFFTDYALLILLAGFGAYVAFRRRSIESIFALILGITGVYIASSFSRLMVYSTLAFAVLGAIGLVELSESILKPTVSSITRKRTRIYESRSEVKVVFTIFMIFLMVLPVFYPASISSAGYDLSHSGWFASANTPVSVANGGTAFATQTSDWFQAFQWMHQTPPGTTIVSWWDYGYWIAVMGNVTSLADNATINETQISLIGRVLVSSPQTSMQILKDQLHQPNYILIFVAGYRFVPSSSSTSGQPTQTYYMLTVPTPYPNPAGGDESKKQWFIRIGNVTCGCLQETTGPRALMYNDDFTPTPYFWANTTLGQLIPLTDTGVYLNPATQATANGYAGTSTSGVNGINAGYTDLYSYRTPTTNSSAPFSLAFESSSLPDAGTSGLFSAVLIYKINYNATF
ncbi:MAG: STT3 domain-containing protein [Nitrososphaerales archaeon]